MYAKCFKRVLDFLFSLLAILVLSPLLLVLTAAGAVVMQGNPFFIQKRPGHKEKIFSLVKFRSMTCAVDGEGNLLPDDKRLTKYGKFLRKTSMDELPELWNILIGDMSLIGPRPLLVEYLPRYNEEQRRRHDVRPGLTGYAQVHGRNAVTWEEKFRMDLCYVENISFSMDLKIFFKTISSVIRRDGISSETCETMEPFTGSELKNTETVDVG